MNLPNFVGHFAEFLAFSNNNVFGRRICPTSSSSPRPLGAAYVPILLSEVEQEQRPSGNGDHEAIVVGAGLCDGEGERAYTVYDTILGEEKASIFNASQEQKPDTGQFIETQFAEREGQFAENYSANCP